MLAALKNSPDSLNMSSLKDYVDPNLMDLYPHDCLFKVTLLPFNYFHLGELPFGLKFCPCGINIYSCTAAG